MLRDRKTYSDFLDGGDGIATNILANRLKELLAQGIIDKSRDPGNRRSFIYSLTDKGFDLAPLIMDLVVWSAKYDQVSKVPDDMLEMIVNDRAGMLERMRTGTC
jgi:DNA-binding HxlR family transcriptional regulator